MALDPNISLAVSAAQPGGGQQVAQANPMGLISGYVDTAQKLQQYRLLNQTLQARQRAGEVIAATPANPDGSINYGGILHNLSADPLTAAFAGDTMNAMRQSALAETQQQSEIGKMQTGGVKSLISTLAGSADDPAAADPLAQSIIQATPTQARGAVQGAYDNLQRYLAPYRSDPGAYKQKLTALELGTGDLAPEAYRQLTGQAPTSVITGPFAPGGGEQPVVVGGPGGGGARMLGPSPSPASTPGDQPNALGVPSPASTQSAGPAAGAGPVAGPSIPTKSFMESRAKDITDELNSLDERVQVGGTILQTLNEARGAMSQIKTGGGAGAYAKAAQLAQALGAPQGLVDKLGNGDLAASQEFAKLMVNTTMGQIQNQVPPGSKLNQQEFKVFNANNPNLDTDPRAIDKIFNFWTRIYNRDYQEQQLFAQQRKQPGFDVLDWPAVWNQHMQQTGMLAPSTGLAGSQQPAEGVPPGAKQWKIEGGKLVPVQ